MNGSRGPSGTYSVRATRRRRDNRVSQVDVALPCESSASSTTTTHSCTRRRPHTTLPPVGIRSPSRGRRRASLTAGGRAVAGRPDAGRAARSAPPTASAGRPREIPPRLPLTRTSVRITVRLLPRLLTANEAAAQLGRNPYLVRRWLEDGRLRGSKFGPVWQVSEREIARFLRKEPKRFERGASATAAAGHREM